MYKVQAYKFYNQVKCEFIKHTAVVKVTNKSTQRSVLNFSNCFFCEFAGETHKLLGHTKLK